ncbi:hypothetical protein N9C66_06885 [Akkermansiaceae bacterium]|nr:hypothetical protein [Akkermansiaceae bacterium]
MKTILFSLFVCIALPSCDSGSSAAKGDESGEGAASEGAASEGAASEGAASEGVDEEKLAKALLDELGKRGREEQKKTVTKKYLKLTQLYLEEFFYEQGFYPVEGEPTSACVYKALSGDPTGQGADPTSKIYWPELNDDRNPELVGRLNGFKVILDGFGQSFRYRSATDADGNPVENVKNEGSFDLWSIGPDGIDGTADDIWP